LGIISERNSQELKAIYVFYLYAVNKAMEIKALFTWTVLFVAKQVIQSVAILGRGRMVGMAG
jgi:hypothetical protein